MWQSFICHKFCIFAKIKNMTAEHFIKALNLKPHPEGGYYSQVYGNEAVIDKKSISTIYYMLENEEFSAFHRLHECVEIWYYHAGASMNIYVIDESGELQVHKLGPDAEMQVVIKPEQWFAADIPSKNGFSLVGCAVGPAFSFNMFELAERENLLKDFPDHAEFIVKLTR